jgi:hypothetical protein
MNTHSPLRLVNFRKRVLRTLPIPRLKKIAIERRLAEAIFRYELQEARNAQETSGRLASVQTNHRYEMEMLSEEEEDIRSQAVIAEARRLDIALPPRPFEDDDNEDWQGGQYFYSQTLSQAGRTKLREAIRKERKDRHEGKAWWLAWLTPIIAVGGIIATILTRK